jgi:hypothetical protein
MITDVEDTLCGRGLRLRAVAGAGPGEHISDDT